MLDCPQTRELIELYVDKELDQRGERELKEHLRQCGDCQEILRALQKTVALITSLQTPVLPANFTERLMARLPAQVKPTFKERWLRQKPQLWRYSVAAAAMMLVILSGWFLSQQVTTQPLAISSDPRNSAIRDGNSFIVPPGTTITGNLTVVDGSLIILGKVTGDVTVVRGGLELAPTAEVAGNTTTIDHPLSHWQYLWLNVSEGIARFAENLRHGFQR